MIKSLQFHPRFSPLIRIYSSSSTAAAPESPDPFKTVAKIILSNPTAALEVALDVSAVRVSPDLAERLLRRFENAGMLAYRFFDWSRKQRHFSHTIKSHHTVIAALAKSRQYPLMWTLVSSMRSNSILNIETFAVIIRKYARAHKVDEAIYTFNSMEKYGVTPNVAAFNSLLSALCKSKNVRKAQELFEEMSDRFSPDAKTYSILIEGWGRAPNLTRMREVFRNMVDRGGCEPDIVTYGIMVDALCKAGRILEAVDVVKDMGAKGCQPTSFIYSILVHAYGAEMRLEDAVAKFLEMEKNGIKPDVVVYNALITAFCRANKFENAFMVLRDMEDEGILPNSRTCNIILSALITVGKNEKAYRVFRWMIKRCEPDADTYTMMIKMFCEIDKLEMALKVWKYTTLKQFVPSMHTFSVLINGLCEKGEVEKACGFMEEMIEKGIRPSGCTFGRLRQLLLKKGREDVLKFLVEKMKELINEPFND